MWGNLFQTADLLEKGIGADWLRNEVISNNISNADTPGFKVSEVEFEDVLASAISTGGLELKTTRDGHLSGGSAGLSSAEPVITTSETTAYRTDDNNVDIEAQMVDLAQNSLHYYTLVSKLNSEFRRLNLAITGGN
ncbi:flagellar basal body rod protein FlgB [Papillibacter cinnamivorans]|uniref:Flagellar basal body rod protein FlgB n=1 Tax=Papillibacter cinnamivorans DSM 12816 TaxID=1122930 RepID=A0A1W1YGP1_9FIRM|nr:flagellar basal body rod protein FlgB [Papillibacter cinnamivorans]SMC35302.1 flagellar basal-body rod protein FlgB [Papillibacter cinnamivorans DSM 12816]